MKIASTNSIPGGLNRHSGECMTMPYLSTTPQASFLVNLVAKIFAVRKAEMRLVVRNVNAQTNS